MAVRRRSETLQNSKAKKKKLHTKNARRNYSEEAMLAAIQDCKAGMPIATSARIHQVPSITLNDKVKGKSPYLSKMGPDPVLSKNEEEGLVEWIMKMFRTGFPVTAAQLKDSIKHILDSMKRETPFNDNRPGRKWMLGFMRRNPSISEKISENLTQTRANVKREQVEQWFKEIEAYLKENNYLEILKDPNRVFNGDETAFFLNPKGKKVLAPKGERSVYITVNSDEKECLTVLITTNADGLLAPPMIVFKYERVPQELAVTVPSGWGIGKSENGWMTGATFYEYFTSIFEPWLTKQIITKPVIVFVDGHTSHLTYHLSKFCEEKKIILIALPPNTTHFLQPMDVSVFHSLKESWKTEVHDWRIQRVRIDANPVLKKTDFSGLLKKVLERKVTKSIVSNGFRRCGLVPWNSKAVCFPFEPHPVTKKKSANEDNKTQLRSAILVLEDYIGAERVKLFRESTVPLRNEDTSLFEIWKQMDDDIKKHESSVPGIVTKLSTGDVEKQPENDQSATVSSKQSTSADQSVSTIVESEPQTMTIEDDDHIGTIPTLSATSNVAVSIPSTSTAPNEGKSLVPSPFKNALMWPGEQKKKINTRRREVIPSVVSSDAYRTFLKKKEEKKLKLEQEKKERALMRAQKKKEKEEMKLRAQELRKKTKDLKELEKMKKTRAKRKNKVETSSDEEIGSEPLYADESEDNASHDQENGSSTDIPNNEEDCIEENPGVILPVVETIGSPSETVVAAEITNNVPELTDEMEVSITNVEIDIANLADCVIVDIERALMDDEVLSRDVTENKDEHKNSGEVLPLEKGDFVVFLKTTRTIKKRMACQILEVTGQQQAVVRQLHCCNRFKTVFVAKDEDTLLVNSDDVIEKLPTPTSIGTEGKFLFNSTIPID